MIFGGKFRDNGINLIPKLLIPKLVEFWPREAKSFLESRIQFVMPLSGCTQPQLREIRPEDAIGKPLRGKFYYLITFGMIYIK